jgi:phosphatidylglycerol---prolipoprotein diacylglyceryl transferase
MRPILFQWGNLSIGSYAALLNLGLIAVVTIVWLDARRRDIRFEVLFDAMLAAIVFGVIGARLGYAAINAAYFKDHVGEIFRLWEGGLFWPAGLIGGSLGAGLIARLHHDRSPARILDRLAIVTPLGLALGWIGCFLSAAAYGREMFPGQPLFFLAIDAPDLYGLTNPRWPSQLLGALWALLVFAGLWLTRDRTWSAGRHFWLFIAAYSLGSLLVGFTRADDMPIVSGWRLDQILDGALTIAGVSGLLATRRGAIDPASSTLPLDK